MNDALKGSPPRPTLGMPVRFYPNASMDESRVEVGIVTNIGQSTVTICILGTTQFRKSVKHKSDERLQKSQEMRQYGCWDFTADWYDRMSTDEYFLEVLAQLDEQIAATRREMELPRLSGKSPQASANRIKAENFGRLRRRASDLGVENVVVMSSSRLRQAIEDAEDRLVEAQRQIEESRKKSRNSQQEDQGMTEEERRREILARAQNNPEAVNLARRNQASVAKSEPSGDNHKAPEPATSKSQGGKKNQQPTTSPQPVPAGAGSEDL